MCIVVNQTVQNCQTHSIHSLYYHDSLTTNLPSLYLRINNSIQLRKNKIVFSEIQNSKMVDHTGSDVLRMIENVTLFIKWALQTLEEKMGENVRSDPVAIYVDTSLPYIIVDIALQKLDIKSLSLYATHGKEAVETILKDENVKIAFSEKMVDVDIVVLCNQKGSNQHHESFGKMTQKVFDFGEILKGKCPQVKDLLIEPDYKTKDIPQANIAYSDLKKPVTQIYTSGTTSSPQPHVVTSGNILSMVDAFFYGMEWHVFENIESLLGENLESIRAAGSSDNETFMEKIIIANDNVHLSYLPLSHIMERLITYLFICLGIKIVYYGGNKKNLLADFKLSKADFLIGAPRVFEHIGKKFETGFFKRIYSLRKWCSQRKFVLNDNSIIPSKTLQKVIKYPVWAVISFIKFLIFMLLEFSIFDTIRSKLNFNFLFTGGAYMKNDLKEMIANIIGAPFYEIYGMSETCGVVSVNNFIKKKDGLVDTVGWPIFPTEWKIYNGELVVRGPNVKEYTEAEASSFVRDEEIETQLVFERNMRNQSIDWDCSTQNLNFKQESLDSSSDRQAQPVSGLSTEQRCFPAPKNTGPWYRTGDLAKIENGLLKITGRLKNNFKLSQGEFIVPERIERIIGTSEIECTVLGKSTWQYLIGLVFLEGCKCEGSSDVANDSQKIMSQHGSTESVFDPSQEKVICLSDSKYILTCEKCLNKQRKILSDRLNKIKTHKLLFGFEIPQKFLFINQSLGEIEGCFTKTTNKLRRNGVWEVFGTALEKIRAE